MVTISLRWFELWGPQGHVCAGDGRYGHYGVKAELCWSTLRRLRGDPGQRHIRRRGRGLTPSPEQGSAHRYRSRYRTRAPILRYLKTEVSALFYFSTMLGDPPDLEILFDK